jgi:uncharacterized protein (DUF2062 family)
VNGLQATRQAFPPRPVARAYVPAGGWRRGIEYIGHRVRRLPDTPHRIALGFCCGVFMSFTPLFGFHFLGALALAWLIRGNLIAAAIGQFFGNPVTLPFIAWISMSLGRRILNQGGPTGRSFERVDEAFSTAFDGLWHTILSWFGMGVSQWGKVMVVYSDVMLPYLLGGILPGLVTSIVCYYLVRPVVAAYQARRRARMLERAHARLEDSAADATGAPSYNAGAGARPGGASKE